MGLPSLPRVAAPLLLMLRLIVLSSFLSPLHLLPAVHLRLMILSSDCGNYPCPAAVEHYAQQTHKSVEGGQGQIAIRRPLDARWENAYFGVVSRTGDVRETCLSVSADANEGLLPF